MVLRNSELAGLDWSDQASVLHLGAYGSYRGAGRIVSLRRSPQDQLQSTGASIPLPCRSSRSLFGVVLEPGVALPRTRLQHHACSVFAVPVPPCSARIPPP